MLYEVITSSCFLSFCKHFFCRIESNQDTLYSLTGAAQHQADIIPLFSKSKCCNLVKCLKQVFNCHFPSYLCQKPGQLHYQNEKRHTSCSGAPFITVQIIFFGSPLENEPPGPFLQAIEPGYYNFITNYLPFHFVIQHLEQKPPANNRRGIYIRYLPM